MSKTTAEPNVARQDFLTRFHVLSPGAPVNAATAALALVVLVSVVGAGIWGALAARNAHKQAQHATASVVEDSLRESVPVLVAANELSTLRSMVMRLADYHNLDRCAVVLADGQVLADSDPSRITAQSIPSQRRDRADGAETEDPDTLSALAATGAIATRQATGASRVPAPEGVPVEVAGLGNVYLVVRPGPAAVTPGGFMGVAVIGALGIAGVLLAGRQALRVLRPLIAIQTALNAAASGERDAGALRIAPFWGPHAEAWNSLLTEHERLRRLAAKRSAEESAASARSNGSALEPVCDAMPQGMLVVGEDWNIRWANGAAGALLRRPREQLIGAPLAKAVEGDEVASVVRAVLHEKVRRRASVELEHRENEETSVVRFTASRVGEEPAECALVQVEDVTQSRIADRARDQFVAQATHELRTPLTNIRLYLETLQEEGETDPAVRGQCINVLSQESRRLERMVSDMLSVSEIQAGSLRLNTGDVRLETLLGGLEDEYRAQAEEKNITLNFDLPPKLPVITGDRDKLAMTLHNLIGNAIKYTPEGGSVTLEADTDESQVRVRVRDTGIGVAPEETERIFERFYRSEDSRVARITGTGLGLALAREVARLHGGDITIDSQINAGSTFTLVLPAAADPPARTAKNAPESAREAA